MIWLLAVIFAVYLLGCPVFVILLKPRDAFEGALLLFGSVLWPLFALGWLVSRPFRYQ